MQKREEECIKRIDFLEKGQAEMREKIDQNWQRRKRNWRLKGERRRKQEANYIS